MPSSRPMLLLCAAVLALACTACAATPSARSVSAPPNLSLTEPCEPDDLTPAASSPEAALPDNAYLPAVFVPDISQQQPSTSPPLNEAASSEPSAPDNQNTLPASSAAQEPDAPLPESPVSAYDFSQPVAQGEAVENDYFADAAFLGDSRSEGFYLYGVKRGKNLSSSGLSVFTFAQKKTFSINGTSCTALEALSQGDYSKVYLGFGINELGYINANAFYQAYCETVDAVRACQPRAVVYAQTIAPVNESLVAASGGAGHLNNDRVRLYNDLIQRAAAEKQIPLLDLYSLFAVDGALPADASRDGVHLSGEYCRKQLEYLKTHTVPFDTLYPRTGTETEVLPNETPDSSACSPVSDTDADRLLPQPEQASLLSVTDRTAAAV